MAVVGLDGDDDGEQLDLLGMPEPKTAEGRAVLAERRGPGRPVGARNKRTQKTVNWLLQRYQDPRAVLLALAGMPVAEMMAITGCSAMEAIAEKRLSAAAVLPYVAQKQPLAVDVTSHKVVTLSIDMGGGMGGGNSDTVLTLDAMIRDMDED